MGVGRRDIGSAEVAVVQVGDLRAGAQVTAPAEATGAAGSGQGRGGRGLLPRPPRPCRHRLRRRPRRGLCTAARASARSRGVQPRVIHRTAP